MCQGTSATFQIRTGAEGSSSSACPAAEASMVPSSLSAIAEISCSYPARKRCNCSPVSPVTLQSPVHKEHARGHKEHARGHRSRRQEHASSAQGMGRYHARRAQGACKRAQTTGAQGARKRAQGARKRAQTTETGARKQYTRDETVPRDQGTKNAQSTRKCATQAVQNGCDSTRDNQTGVLYCTVWREGVLPTTTASHCTRDAAVHKTI